MAKKNREKNKNKNTEKLTVKQIKDLAKKPAERLTEKLPKKLAEKLAGKLPKKPTGDLLKKRTKKTAKALIEEPAEKPAVNSTEEPVEVLTGEAEEAAIETPIENLAVEPAEDSADEPTEVPEDAAAEASAEEPAEVPADESEEVSTEVPIDEPTETPADEPTEMQTDEPAETPEDAPTEASQPTETPVSPEKPKKKRKMRPIVKVLIAFLCLCFIAAAAVFGYALHVAGELGDVEPESIYSNIEMSSYLYDSKGEEIDRLYYTEDREAVSIEEIPENTRNAFIAIEDKTFYNHHGLNLKRMFGAVLQKITGHADEISGTSTITQQLARNVFLPEVKSQRTLKRKFKEIVYACKIEHDLTKDEILEAYLNTIYLGYGCYGIKSAAYTYFGKDVSKLTLAESAALAALPQAPDTFALLRDTKGEDTKYLKKYDLYANDKSKERREQVLDLMVEQGYIDAEEAENSKVKLTKLLKPHFEEHSNEFTYFTDYVITDVAKDLSEKYSMTDEEAQQLIHTGGLRIYSTIDQDIQREINEEFSNDYNFPYAEEDPQAAMVVVEVATGNIKAMVGGRNASGQKLYNRAVNPRQPGSSIKPLSVYSAALQKSFEYAERGEPFPFVDYGFDSRDMRSWGTYLTAGSRVIDSKMKFNDEEWPQNYGRRYSGYNTFRTALQRSINTCAVKIQLQVGSSYSIEMLKKYGISTLVDDISVQPNDINPAALGLGAMTYGVTPLDMALAYATFPNGGVRNSGASYTKVTDAEGKEILKKETETTKVLDEGVAFIMTDCLKSVVSRGIAGNASIYGIQVGGKTGTTNDDYDYWFCGFTPKYAAALWMGTDHNVEMSWTSSSAALLWSRVMEDIPDITEGEYPEQPANVIYQYGEYYTEGTEP